MRTKKLVIDELDLVKIKKMVKELKKDDRDYPVLFLPLRQNTKDKRLFSIDFWVVE
jgi:hypothetical protein